VGILVTSSYDTGAAVWKPGAGNSLKKVWSGDDSVSAHFSSPVAWKDWVFGFHGRQEQGVEFRCVEAATGKVRWSAPEIGSGSVLRVGDRLLVLREDGELVLGEASAERWQPLARAQVLGTGIRALPAWAGGTWYGRDKRELVAVELAP
jgi:outer membrane protein assembly factor BamB